jgi:hypothetical protein
LAIRLIGHRERYILVKLFYAKPGIEEPLLNVGTFALPAENANVAEPDLLGVTTSGPSFKIARRGGSSTKMKQNMTADELKVL